MQPRKVREDCVTGAKFAVAGRAKNELKPRSDFFFSSCDLPTSRVEELLTTLLAKAMRTKTAMMFATRFRQEPSAYLTCRYMLEGWTRA